MKRKPPLAEISPDNGCQGADAPAAAPKPTRWRNKIGFLPAALKDELDRRLRDGAFSSYRGLSAWLAAAGYRISHAALHKYGQKFERRLEAVRIALSEARVIVEQTAGDDEQMQRALMTIAQTRLFGVLTALEEGRTDGAPPNIAAVARSVSGLVRAGVTLERWTAQKSARIARQVGEVAERIEEARAHGLSPDAAEKIRAALLEIEP
jgi:Bacteriophage Mu, Gp27